MNRLFEIKKQLENGKNIYDMPLRVCFYARVSTDKDEQLNSLGNQVSYFTEFIGGKENWEFAGGYIDEGISGKSVEKRTNFLKMIKDAKSGLFDLVITKEISRFSRSTLDSIKYTQDLLTNGVGVLFQSDNINTLLPDSELRLTIMASIAQEEVRKLSERLRFGYKRSIEKGRVLGQNNTLGYHKENGKLSIVEGEAVIIRKIFQLYIEGKFGLRRIAREREKEGFVSPNTGKIFGADSLKYILQNPKYKGFYCSGKTVSLDYRQNKRVRLNDNEWNTYKDESIPAIVSEEIWDMANTIYKQRGEKARKNEGAYLQRYPFSGKLICGEHGTSFHRHIYKSKRRGEQEVWNCKLYRQKGKQDGCDSPTLYTTELQQILSEIYKKVYDNREQVVSGLLQLYSGAETIDYSAEITTKQNAIDKMQKSKDKLLELLMEEILTKEDFKQRNDTLSEEIKKLNEEIAEINKEIKILPNFYELKKSLEYELKKADNFNAEMGTILLEKIVVHKQAKNHVRLDIHLKVGNVYTAQILKQNVISLEQIGISQAQVSRLEKNALKNMRKYIS
jgi:DNA invertase Pin-like site-specific DNA recombinase